MREIWPALEGVVWDWGDTLMRDIPGQAGPMVEWPRVEAMPGAAAALRALSVVPLQCVATNAAESGGSEVAEALGRVGLREHLTFFFTSKELGVQKPEPEFFLRVARELAIPPDRLLAIGNDLAKDVLPAKAAGLATAWVAANPATAHREAVDVVAADLFALAEIVRRSLPGAAPGIVRGVTRRSAPALGLLRQ